MKTILIAMLMMITDQPRQVLLFYTENGQAMQLTQIKELDGRKDELKERDIQVRSILYSKGSEQEWKKWDMDTNQAFTYLLVGRDGGEKYRSQKVVSANMLFGLVDAMPMRKSEVRRKP